MLFCQVCLYGIWFGKGDKLLSTLWPEIEIFYLFFFLLVPWIKVTSEQSPANLQCDRNCNVLWFMPFQVELICMHADVWHWYNRRKLQVIWVYSEDAIIKAAKRPRTKDWSTKLEYDCAFLGFKTEWGNQTACLSQEAALQGRQLVPLKLTPLQ